MLDEEFFQAGLSINSPYEERHEANEMNKEDGKEKKNTNEETNNRPSVCMASTNTK